MHTILSYILLVTLALSGLSGSVQPAMASTLADSLVAQHQPVVTADMEMPCHTMQVQASDENQHDCCEQAEHQCKDDCCTKHCATGSALLTTELFRYIRPDNRINRLSANLPNWLFADEPPPPINA
jgi:hypothetical protein